MTNVIEALVEEAHRNPSEIFAIRIISNPFPFIEKKKSRISAEKIKLS
jgi:hypothetical protein